MNANSQPGPYEPGPQMKHNTALEKWHRDMVEEVIDV